jgi:hypothetical protein
MQSIVKIMKVKSNAGTLRMEINNVNTETLLIVQKLYATLIQNGHIAQQVGALRKLTKVNTGVLKQKLNQ